MALIRLEPVQFIEAIAAAMRRRVLLPADYYGLIPAQARARAFTVSGLARLEQIQAVSDSLARVLTDGGTFEQWQQRALDGELRTELPRHRLETIYRTNLQSAWNRGRAEQIKRHLKTHPYLEYSAVNDSRTRPAHAAMDGTILRADHPWWRTHYPPNGFNCRCRAIALTAAQAEKRGITSVPTSADPDQGWAHSELAAFDPIGLRQAIARHAVSLLGRATPVASTLAQMQARLRDPQAFSGGLRELVGTAVYDQVRRTVEAAALRQHVPVDAAAALRLYTMELPNYYRDLNATLRYIGNPAIKTLAVRDPDRLLPLLDGIHTALQALPVRPGLAVRRLSEADLPDGFLEAHRAGSLVRYNSLTSTAELGGKMPPGLVTITIKHSSGRLIRDFSRFGREREVLLPPGVVFRVVSARRLASGTRIALEEVTEVPTGVRVYDFGAKWTPR